MKITIPELALVVLIGPSGSGKSTFARQHFLPTEILSSDYCRGLVSDDENNQEATNDAFEVLHFIAARRLARGRLVVVDATNVQPEARKPLVELARRYHVIPVAIVLNTPEKVCLERNRLRSDRDFGPHVIRRQLQQLRASRRNLAREGFRHVFELAGQDDFETSVIERQPLWNNLKHEHGPFDIIGDVHGCYEELETLLTRLGYLIKSNSSPATTGGEEGEGAAAFEVSHPQGRKAVFVGDLVDRGPQIPQVLRLVMSMVRSGSALCVPGNHDLKLMRKLRGRDVQSTHGLAESLSQLEAETPRFKEEVAQFLDGLVSHYVLDDGRLVVAHAGLKEELQGRGSGKVRDFALYGETTGETDEFGLPVRYNWAAEYRGKAMVVYGHTPVPQAEWLNNTICIDTGCVYGGNLTALRYPERELVAVPAARVYYESTRPFPVQASASAAEAPELSAQQAHDEVLDLEDVVGKRVVSTRLYQSITIREENALAALEVMSRFAANPKWLVYLPPTMSPSETSQAAGYLEHPAEAFAYYRQEGVPEVICEEKHMGSRAVVIVCRDEETARRRFGVSGEGAGICYTRTGRRFFDDPLLEAEFLDRLRQALTASGFWERFNSGWAVLDCELMPWSAKAQGLIREQYAAVGAASRLALSGVVRTLKETVAGNPDLSPEVGSLLERYRERQALAERYVAAYRRYCWPVRSIADLKLAPFHLLATEGAVHTGQPHSWHMETLAELCRADSELLVTTPCKVVAVTDEASQAEGVAWWETLTGQGGEGMVVKPLDFVARGRRGLVQPAVKCRGRDYLRIIYGPEYTIEENLNRLRSRGLSAKRSLALREFALGLEGLERFTRGEPLRRVHECAFGVLALESEQVDPRL
ncbi:MAG TPA: polynucleotide kinase-phosphatase [Chloroflexia bacterium]|nr:polynucleotide kinase-phosphatase [Chloroflexia bacterium]